MKNDKYYGSLPSRDNQWGVQFEFCQKSGYYHYLYFLESVSQGCIIDRRPDRLS